MKVRTLTITIFLMISSMSLFAEIVEVNNDKIDKLIKVGVPLVDIRTEREWYETGVIDQSNLLTFFDKYGNSKVEEWITKFEKIAGRKDPVIIICRSGRRSRVVANYLVQKENYLTVYHATNGIKSWIESNNKIVEPE
ncbi:uncharacterized protein METZ01_LOCUS254856 [marine metagenome]|uniref:Rhodanese domain-containing protein n=1 Tax=marine metagenome TaxID=408172 RepID=A0A382IRZ0_9ZZZZ